MNASDRLKVVDGIAYYRLGDPRGFRRTVQDVSSAISMAREQGLHKLLVVITTEAINYEPPGVGERHAMVREWAEAAEGMVAIAVVVPPTYIDPEKFGVVTAANFGLAGNTFSNEAEATTWLREPH